MWRLLEIFTHGVTLLRDEDFVGEDRTYFPPCQSSASHTCAHTTVVKLSMESFRNALEGRDRIDPEDKMRVLKGIKKALKILFRYKNPPEDFPITTPPPDFKEGEMDDDDDDELGESEEGYEGTMDSLEEGELGTDDLEASSEESSAPKIRTGKTGAAELIPDWARPDEDSLSDGVLAALPDIPLDIPDENFVMNVAPDSGPGGIPPPPGMGPAPPPPPGMPPPLPDKAAFVGIKLKRFNWNKVPPMRIRTSMWPQANKNTKGIVLEEKTLEALFYVKTGKEVEVEKKEKSLNILDLQRANNVGK